MNTPYANTAKDSNSKVLLFSVLGVMAILISIGSYFYFLSSLNKAYDSSISENSKELIEIRNNMMESTVYHRLILNNAIITDSSELSRLQLLKEKELNKLVKSNLALLNGEQMAKEITGELNQNLQNYLMNANEFIAYCNKGSRTEISAFLLKHLRPSFDRLQESQKKLFHLYTEKLIKEKADLNTKSRNIGLILLILGMSPFIYVFYKIITFFTSL